MKLLVGSWKKVSTLISAGLCQSAEALSTFMIQGSVDSSFASTMSSFSGSCINQCAVALSTLTIELAGDSFAFTMSSLGENFRSTDLVFGVKRRSSRVLVSCFVNTHHPLARLRSAVQRLDMLCLVHSFLFSSYVLGTLYFILYCTLLSVILNCYCNSTETIVATRCLSWTRR